MKTQLNFVLCGISMSALLWSCTADDVKPKSQTDRPAIGHYGENIHTILNPACSNTADLRLRSAGGSYTVDYLCSSNCPEWGTVQVVNGADSIGISISMATGWMIDYSRSGIATNGAFQFEQGTGLPQTTGTHWSLNDVNPIMNRQMVYLHRNNIAMGAGNTFSIALNVTACRASFLGTVIPASVRSLWAVNDDWNVSGSEWASTSPYLLGWTWAACPPALPVPDSIFPAGMQPTTTCITLQPETASLGSDLSFEWDNGSTASTLEVCPGMEAAYYTVNIYSGNSEVPVATKVYYMPSVPTTVTLTAGQCIRCETSFNTTFSADCGSVNVASACKDLSNIRVGFSDCTTIKFDGLSGRNFSYTAPAGKEISAVWVKAGCYQSGECPGCGLRVDSPYPGCQKNSNCTYSFQ